MVLIRCSPECLVFMNSWGQDWADGGFFRVKDASVLNNMKFFDVYWIKKDLTQGEKKAYEVRALEKAEQLHKQYPSVDDLIFQCPLCNQNSRVGSYEGNFLEAKCPRCKDIFKPKNEDLAKTLYLKNM